MPDWVWLTVIATPTVALIVFAIALCFAAGKADRILEQASGKRRERIVVWGVDITMDW